MHSATLWFATADFVDSPAERSQRINEDIGGAALASWLSAQMQSADFKVKGPWPEDHGWDFDIVAGNASYICVCTIEDGTDEREACVQIVRRTSFVDRLFGRKRLSADDPVLSAVLTILEARGVAVRHE